MPTDAQSSTTRDAAATKRLKKREIDRRCQREARQRTKSRIAYLEGLVEELRRKDTSGQVASLMQQVSDVRKERDMFARTLRGIEDSIRGHRSLREGMSSKEPGGPPSEERPASSTDVTEHLATGFPAPSHAAADSWPEAGTKSVHSDPMAIEEVAEEISPQIAATVPPETPAWAAADPNMTPYGPPIPHPMFPGDGGNCECCELMSPQEVTNSTTREMERKNIWRFAHTVLDKPPLMTPKVLRWEDDNSEDVPVRAIAEGWSAVEARLGGHLPPIWRKLRRIDEVVFSDIGHVERLAILRVMHWLMRYHADPASQKARVPPWYLARWV
jgi:hypothetical protein